jgi:hypothetical protein
MGYLRLQLLAVHRWGIIQSMIKMSQRPDRHIGKPVPKSHK